MQPIFPTSLHSFFSIKVSLLLTSFYGNFPKQIFYKHYSHRFCLYRNFISRNKDCNLYLQCNENALIKLLMLLLYNSEIRICNLSTLWCNAFLIIKIIYKRKMGRSELFVYGNEF